MDNIKEILKEDNFKEILNILPIPIFFIEKDKYTFYNNHFKNLFGIDENENNDIDFLSENVQKEIFSKIERFKRNNYSVDQIIFELPIVCSDNLPHDFQFIVSLINSDLEEYIGIIVNVTIRNKMEQVLIAHQKQMDTIVSLVNDGVIVYSEKGSVLLWNKEAEKLFGYKKSDMIGESVTLICTNILNITKNMNLDKNKEVLLELELYDSSKKAFPAECLFSLVKSQNKSNIVVVIRDITSKKQLEDLLNKNKKNDLSVLIAEDQFINAKLLKKILMKQGWNSYIAESGIEAVNAFKKEHFDIVLMDIQMPEMDGITATKEIRKLEGEKKHIPIIALTGYNSLKDKEKFLSSGFDDFLSKPIETTTLIDKINYWINKKEDETIQNIEDIVNFKEILFTLDYDYNLFEKLFSYFFDNYPSHLNQIELFLSKNEKNKASKHAHILKGEMLNLSITGGLNYIIELEEKIENLTTDEINRNINRLRKIFLQIETFFRSLLKKQ